MATGNKTRRTRRRACPDSAHAADGFTLLELLVVVALLGIVITFATLSRSSASGRVLEDTARQLVATVTLVEQESILRRRPLGISFYRTGYGIRPIGTLSSAADDDPLFGHRRLPDGIEVVGAPERASGRIPAAPAFVMLPDGEVTLQEIVLAEQGSGQWLRLAPRDGRLAVGERGP